MKIYLEMHQKPFCLYRISDALVRFKPDWVEIVNEYDKADLVIMHITGRHDHRTIEGRELLQNGQQYAVIQLVLGSCRNPDPADWKELWEGARVVWSYYNLPKSSNFYHAPLAANKEIFFRENVDKKYLVGSIGPYWRDECIGELQHAIWYARRGRGVHIGEPFGNNPVIDYKTGLSDDEMRMMYNSCKWFSCLRRKDGFEIQAIEALLCGVRPIMFDVPNYRQWFDGLAYFIPESSVQDVSTSIWKALRREPRPVTDEEIEETKCRFDWKTIVEGFYARIINPDPSPQ